MEAEASGSPVTDKHAQLSPDPDAPLDAATDGARTRKSSRLSAVPGVDEAAGPKDFYHPASVEPQRVVWVPRDGLGLGEAEARAIGEMGIRVSLDDARMDEKGHVDISGPPPGGEVRVL